MRSVILAAIGLCLSSCASLPPSRDAQEAGGSNSVLALERFADLFDRAQLDKDGAALERMVADDLLFIDGSGKRLGKAEFISGWTDPADTYDPIKLIDRVVMPLGANAGLVTAETILSGSSGGKKFSSRFRFTDTFERRGGEWRAVHIQVTRIPATS